MDVCVLNSDHESPKWLFNKKDTDIYRCTVCGCIMADNTFVHDQYESDDYYTLMRKTRESVDHEWGFRWRYILGEVVRHTRPTTLLDVGAGNGYFVALAREEFGLEASGLEISEKEIAFAKQVLGVELCNEDVARHKGTYDIVTAFNVLEHVADPVGFMGALVAHLEPTGLLLLTTPNPGCIHARVKGLQGWSMVDPPHHINLFTGRALRELLARYQLVEVEYATLSTYINVVRKLDTSDLHLRRAVFQALRLLGLGADHFVIARRAV